MNEPLYKSRGAKSIISLSQIYNEPTVVYFDESIGHLQTNEIESIDKYYDEQYEFFNQSDEDDILYKVIDGKKIFRQQHQVDTLVSKIQLNSKIEVLDYGCGKGTVTSTALGHKHGSGLSWCGQRRSRRRAIRSLEAQDSSVVAASADVEISERVEFQPKVAIDANGSKRTR